MLRRAILLAVVLTAVSGCQAVQTGLTVVQIGLTAADFLAEPLANLVSSEPEEEGGPTEEDR